MTGAQARERQSVGGAPPSPKAPRSQLCMYRMVVGAAGSQVLLKPLWHPKASLSGYRDGGARVSFWGLPPAPGSHPPLKLPDSSQHGSPRRKKRVGWEKGRVGGGELVRACGKTQTARRSGGVHSVAFEVPRLGFQGPA